MLQKRLRAQAYSLRRARLGSRGPGPAKDEAGARACEPNILGHGPHAEGPDRVQWAKASWVLARQGCGT